MVGPSLKKTRLSHDKRFHINSGHHAEFITLRGHLQKNEMIHPCKKNKENNELLEKENNELPGKNCEYSLAVVALVFDSGG